MNKTALVLALILLALATKIFMAYTVPLFFDEVYYVDWARHLSWGYLDHPPGVALLSYFGILQSDYILARLPTLLIAIASIVPLLGLARMIGISSSYERLGVLLFFFTNLFGMTYGSLTLPDAGLTFFWILASHEFLRALKGHSLSWITTGFSIGLGFLCKYIMVLFLPVMLLTIIFYQREALKKSATWMGFAFFLMTLAPHIAWNAQHEWASFKFQFNRGFFKEYTKDTEKMDLPQVLDEISEKDFSIAARLIDPLEPLEKPKKDPGPFAQFVKRNSNYWNANIFAWGLLLIPISVAVLRRRWRQTFTDSTALGFLWINAALPLLFFGLVTLFTKTEGNWASIYVIATSLLLVAHLHMKLRWIALGSFLNILLSFVIILQAQGSSSHAKRILHETKDYKAIAQNTAEHAYPTLFADRYQLVAQLNYFTPHLRARQFPGLSRDSEYTRSASPLSQDDFLQFSLVTGNFPPPSFSQYQIASMWEFRRCLKGEMQVRAATTHDEEPRCRGREKLSLYYLVNYTKI